MRMVLSGAVLALSIAVQQNVSAQQPGSDPAARFALTGCLDGRQALVSGEFTCRGTKHEVNPELGNLRGTVEIYSVFDHRKGLFRFDRSETQRVFADLPAVNGKVPQVWKPVIVGGKRIETPTQTICYTNGERAVLVSGPGKAVNDWVQPFDARCLGIVLPGGLKIRTSFAYFISVFGREKMSCQVKGGHYTLEWEVIPKGAEGTQYRGYGRMIVDEAQGFSPIRYESLSSQTGDIKTARQESLVETSWLQYGETWVPRTMTLRWNSHAGTSDVFDLKFEWKSVNAEIPDSVFTPQGLGLPRGTNLISNELGRTIQLGEIGKEDMRPTAVEPRRFPWLGIAITSAAMLAFTALTVSLLRKKAAGAAVQ